MLALLTTSARREILHRLRFCAWSFLNSVSSRSYLLLLTLFKTRIGHATPAGTIGRNSASLFLDKSFLGRLLDHDEDFARDAVRGFLFEALGWTNARHSDSGVEVGINPPLPILLSLVRPGKAESLHDLLLIPSHLGVMLPAQQGKLLAPRGLFMKRARS
jgi:hypothetical protein